MSSDLGSYRYHTKSDHTYARRLEQAAAQHTPTHTGRELL